MHHHAQTVLDILGVRQRRRGTAACRRLANLMTELRWTAVPVRGLMRGGYREQVRRLGTNAVNIADLDAPALPVRSPERRIVV